MRWEEFVKETEGGAVDPNALVQEVLRESYLQTTEDLRYYAEKVKHFNQAKKLIREYLQKLRDYDIKLRAGAREKGIDLCAADKKSRAEIAKLASGIAHAMPADEVSKALGLPKRISSADLSAIEAEIKKWEEKLNSLGDDAQLANVDLQNILQKQQQTLQMMSNISKMLHDTAMSVIRKMGG
ncbi:MAG: hypothetical protein M3R13_06070 [Armatimonadota bacterium]|nr:hypothetical protein [Armatimonadota bacterium]